MKRAYLILIVLCVCFTYSSLAFADPGATAITSVKSDTDVGVLVNDNDNQEIINGGVQQQLLQINNNGKTAAPGIFVPGPFLSDVITNNSYNMPFRLGHETYAFPFNKFRGNYIEDRVLKSIIKKDNNPRGKTDILPIISADEFPGENEKGVRAFSVLPKIQMPASPSPDAMKKAEESARKSVEDAFAYIANQGVNLDEYEEIAVIRVDADKRPGVSEKSLTVTALKVNRDEIGADLLILNKGTLNTGNIVSTDVKSVGAVLSLLEQVLAPRVAGGGAFNIGGGQAVVMGENFISLEFSAYRKRLPSSSVTTGKAKGNWTNAPNN